MLTQLYKEYILNFPEWGYINDTQFKSLVKDASLATRYYVAEHKRKSTNMEGLLDMIDKVENHVP